MEVTKSLQPAGRFRLPLGETEGQQTTRLGLGVEEKDSTGVQEDRHHGSGLAHISAHGGNHAGRDGRTPTNDPGLLAPREFACNQQVSSGNDNEQAFGTRKVGGRHSARGRAIGKQINFDPLGSARENPNGPKLFLVGLRKPFKRMAGTTGLEPAASAVTGQRSNQLNYVPTRQINKIRNYQCL